MSLVDQVKGINLSSLQSALNASGLGSAMQTVTVPPKAEVLAPGEIGINETKDVVTVLIDIIKALFFPGISKLTGWVAVMLAIPQAIIGISKVPQELGDLDETETKELVDFVKSELPEVTDEYALKIIGYAIQALYFIYMCIASFIESKAAVAAAKVAASNEAAQVDSGKSATLPEANQSGAPSVTPEAGANTGPGPDNTGKTDPGNLNDVNAKGLDSGSGN